MATGKRNQKIALDLMESKNSGGSFADYGASERAGEFKVKIHLKQFLILIYFFCLLVL